MKYKFSRKLNEIGNNDFLLAGGKATNLGEMIQAGLPVPGGFVVITEAYRRFTEVNQLDQKISSLLENVGMDDIVELEKVSIKIRELFTESRIPEDILSDLAASYRELGSPEVAVRSSATAEDLPGLSFAGQYDTYLNVSGTDQLTDKVRQCWASLWNARAISYRIRQKIDHKDVAHAVVVQEMVNAEKSGILFTANPVNGRRDQILLNASWGLGEAIVGGDVTPDQWVVNKETKKIEEETIAKKTVMTVRINGGIRHTEVSAEKQKESTMDQKEVMEMLDFAVKVEKYFGSPQDLEWAWKEGVFYLVQTRPITSLYPVPESSEGREGLRVYINMNLYSQAMKEPFTPMGAGVMQTMVENLVKNYGKKKVTGDRLWYLKNIDGRIYIDMTEMLNKKRFLKKLENNPSDKDPVTTRALLQTAERYKEEIASSTRGFSVLSKLNLRVMRLAIDNIKKVSYGKKDAEQARMMAIKEGQSIIKKMESEKKKLSTREEKIRFIEKYAGELFVSGFGVVFYVAASSGYIEKVKAMMEKHLGDSENLNKVEKSVPYSVTTEMGMELMEIARELDADGKKATKDEPVIKDFLEKYGHRASIELDVGDPTWKENPEYILDIINASIDNKTYQEAIDRFFNGKQEAEEAIVTITNRFMKKGLKKQASQAEKMLRDFREMFGVREYPKFYVRKFIAMFKDIIQEIGQELVEEGRLKNVDDVFFVTLAQIQDPKNDLKQMSKENREIYEREFKRNAPRIVLSSGESIYSPTEEGGDNILGGVAVSPGVYEGIARILHHPEEGHQLQKGEILVTTGTNPSWTPLFLKIGALVMETGGPISHGSVVAREYGVPAVAGVNGATEKIENGQKIRVNGESGRVELL